MIKDYIKQAWELMKQNPLFSSLYIIGTAMAICFTTVMAVAYYVKLAPLYPEYNRNLTYYNDHVRVETPDSKNIVNSGFSYTSLRDWLYPLKNVEAVSGTIQEADEHWIHPSEGNDFSVSAIYTDPGFFKIYEFEFIEGTSFSQADFDSGVRTVVISDKLAQKAFHQTTGVVGKMLNYDMNDYRVCGVVKAGSKLGSMSYSDVYLPYKAHPSYQQTFYYDEVGAFFVRFKVKNKAQAEALQEELDAVIANVNQQNNGEKTVSTRPIRPHFSMVFDDLYWGNGYKVNFWILLKYFLPILMVLLLIPALNLSGMISSRMEDRLAEMGVRKSFGASRSVLLSQVMWENLILTLAGGLVGLIIAWSMLLLGKSWIFTLFEDNPDALYDNSVTVTGEMLFSPTVFISALLVCVIINLLSALIPAWNSLRKPIVSSLNEKK
ncbi:MAG: FtsX-like permease family protein [Bacteroidaceae bacterium]|nr:FtsX-like permease family protein [Bacteroidaceae bacterium]